MKPGVIALVDDSDDSNIDHEQPTALVAASSSSSSSGVVVDLTGKRTVAPRTARRQSDEVEFIGMTDSTSSRRRGRQQSAFTTISANATASSRTSHNNSFVEYIGTSRPTRRTFENPFTGIGGRAVASFAGIAVSLSSFGGGGGGGGGQRSASAFSASSTLPRPSNQGIDLDALLEQHNRLRRNAGLGPTDINRKRKHSESAIITNTGGGGSINAMTKGKVSQEPQGFESIDMYYPRLKANDRTLILYNLLRDSSSSSTSHDAVVPCTKKFVHDWRVKFDQSHPKRTLWSMALAFSGEVTRRKENKIPNDNYGKKQHATRIGESDNDFADNWLRKKTHLPNGKGFGDNTSSCVGSDEAETKGGRDDSKSLKSPIDPVSRAALSTLQTHFMAHLRHSDQKAFIQSIQPIDHGPISSSLACSICADDFESSDIVACSGNDDIHFFCKPCLYSYCTVTVQSGPVQSMCCPMPSCQSLFATHDVQSTLSDWDILMIENREDSRDRRVAMVGKAILHCECGVVAIIAENDMGDGRITCPGAGCARRYCAKCGNDDHGAVVCPPPAEMVQWLSKHSKPCPNCTNPIEKNGGCDHMTCQPPFGCGHEFWYSCGCPYKGPHKCGMKQGQNGMF